MVATGDVNEHLPVGLDQRGNWLHSVKTEEKTRQQLWIKLPYLSMLIIIGLSCRCGEKE